jgi:transcription elongation factor GreB
MRQNQRNYITPGGIEKLRNELRELLHVERPALVKTVAWAASNGDRSENADYIYGKRRLREIDRRCHFLTKRIEAAEVIDPAKLSGERIVFGATVTVIDEDDVQQSYVIVGEDESAPEKGRVSWRSPLATALLGKKVDDEVLIRRPGGDVYITISEIKFVALD